jgi:hypothetical protein
MAGETPLPVVLNTPKCLPNESSPGTNDDKAQQFVKAVHSLT